MRVETSTRVVFILGRRTRLGARELEAASAGASEVVVLSLGYPVSRAQRQAVDGALELAGRLRVTMDVVLVTAPADLAGAVGPTDRVIISGSRGEERRLGRQLATI